LGDEKLNAVDCWRYEVAGAAFGGVKGSLWINTKDRLIERFEHALPDNPEWNSLRLVRMGARTMNAAAWSAFKDATVLRANTLRNVERK
jgi:hypothetical protein